MEAVLENKRRKSIALIIAGALNVLHASTHLIQFVQSIILVSISSTAEDHEGFFENIIHNPILNIIWAIIGLFTLYLGIKDFRHHKNCKH